MTCDFRRLRVTIAAALVSGMLSYLLCAPRASHALTFNFNPLAGISQEAMNGFTTAGNIWSSFLTDNVTININVGYSRLDSGVLAQAASVTEGFSYSAVRAALISDATSLLDATATANLQTGSALRFLTNNASGAVILDANGSGNNFFLNVNTANAKALGLIAGNAAGRDATIEFSSDFNFDFDRSNGISSNSFDFVGLAVHEIGHALGFVSGVDAVDYFSGPTTGLDINGQRVAAQSLDGFRVLSPLDLFRFSSASTDVASIGFGVQDITQATESYFSIDKGLTNLGGFSTGSYDGDGRQASHWKDGQGLGVMDPTVGTGEQVAITQLDLLAFDAMGWNLAPVEIPEPSSFGLMSGALFVFGSIRVLRRRKRTG